MRLNNPSVLETLKPIPLDPVENYFWRFEKELSGAFRIALLLRVEGLIQANFLDVALQQIQWRHPKLRAKIITSPRTGPRYQTEPSVSTIPFKIIDCYEDESPWRDETRQLLQAEFAEGVPLAAVTVLRHPLRGCSEIILTISHTIADGLSAVVAIDDLLTEYAKAEAGLESSPSSLPLVTVSRAKWSVKWRSQLRVLRRFVRLNREEKQLSITTLPEATGVVPYSQWVHWVFSTEDTLSLTRRCRREKVSLGSAMIGAVCCGIMDCLNTSRALFRWQFPFNMREQLKGLGGPVTSQDIGCFMTNMNGMFNVTEPLCLWDLARIAEKEIQFFFQHGGPSFGYNMAAYLRGASIAIHRLLALPPSKLTPSAGPRATVFATNYGVLNMKSTYGSIKPLECTLTYKNETAGPSLLIEALVLVKKLNIGFAADDLDPAFWNELHVAVRKQISHALGST